MFPLYHTVLYRQSFSTRPFLSGWLSACHYTIWLNLIAWRCVARGSVGCGRKCCAAKLPRATCGASSRASIGQASPKSAKQIRSWGMTYRMEIVNEWTFDCLFPTQYIILSSAQQNLHDNLQFESQAKLLESKTLAHFTSRCNTPVKSIFFPKASSMLGFSFSCLTVWGSDLGCADGCGRQMGAEIAWTAADGVGATEWLEMGGEKKPLVMSDLGCADGCGRQMGAEIAWTAADGVGATEWLEMGGEKKPVMSDLGCADSCGRQMGAENCADGCGRRGCNGVAGNGWGEEAAGDERPWLRGRLRTANGCGELRGRLRTEWAQRSGWKWVGRRSRCGDERPWLRGRLRTANGCGELRGRLRTAWVQGGGSKL